MPPRDPHISPKGILHRVYISHSLSAWNSRLFEFGAILFLAHIYPGTLLFASTYAFFRSLAATCLSGLVGRYIDGESRLVAVRWSIVLQRIPVALSGVLFGVLWSFELRGYARSGVFALLTIFACVEKLASIANTIAIERDWIIVIAGAVDRERQGLNAVVRRIDLLCKLFAPLVISGIDAVSTISAIHVMTVASVLSFSVEYFTIARVFYAVPQLARPEQSCAVDHEAHHCDSTRAGNDQAVLTSWNSGNSCFPQWVAGWSLYFTSPVLIPSLTLSLLYLTVLSTGVQYQTYMMATGFSATSVSIFRLGAVLFELGSTLVTPLLIRSIGSVRSGLWSLTWQLSCLTAAMIMFTAYGKTSPAVAGYGLSLGIIVSRVGLWGVDLCVQDLIQEEIQDTFRGQFSASEASLQNVFELLSFASTIAFPKPEEFSVPSTISLAAVATSACLFAAFVRKRRGHLLHPSRCLQRKQDYQQLADIGLDTMDPEDRL